MEFDPTMHSLDFVQGDDSKDLAAKLNGLKFPIRLVGVVSSGTRHIAYFVKFEKKDAKKTKLSKE